MHLVYPIGSLEGTEISWGRNYARNALFYVRSDEVTCCVHIGMLLCSIICSATLNQNTIAAGERVHCYIIL
ncbi:hypothetical protein ANAPH2_01556 [Anaplasma phagocytophilum]|nr:hypothetical protein ANAPH2_01556 [Anaplasma phagocytophilum]